MTVPGRVEAASLLLSLDPPPWFVRHSRAVAEVAGWLAARIEARGIPVDRRVVEAGALLHDADKALPIEDPARGLRHGDGSAAWLTRIGHPELGRAVANHPVTRLGDEVAYRKWAGFASREERIVAYADKRAAQRLEPMAARFDRWRRRHLLVVKDGHAEGWDESEMRTIWLRAVRLERDVCRAAGVEPDEVGQAPLDRRGLAGGPRASACGRRETRPRVTASPLAYLWGDDELSAGRAVDRMATALAAETGAPLERWELRGDRNAAASLLANLHERVATPVMFGGGTLAVVTNAGALTVKTEHRDAFLNAISLVAPGNALVVLEASQSGARAPAQKRLVDAIASAGGTVREFKSPRAGALAGWIEAEARERGLRLAPGTAKTLAERVGGFVQEGDAERRHQTRIASIELDKLALFRGEGGVIGPDDVRALVAEAVPGTVWGFTDAVGERRRDRALELLDRLLETHP